MATSFARSLCRIIPQFARIEQRQTYGALDDAFDAANSELELGNYKNAWTLLMESLGQDLFKRWNAVSQKKPKKSRAELLAKLRSANQIDRWELELLTFIVTANPGKFTLRQTDLLLAIVKVFTFHNPGPKIQPKPAPPAKPLPTEAEVRAERERLEAERAAFLDRGDELALPHWQAHHRALAAIGLCG